MTNTTSATQRMEDFKLTGDYDDGYPADIFKNTNSTMGSGSLSPNNSGIYWQYPSTPNHVTIPGTVTTTTLPKYATTYPTVTAPGVTTWTTPSSSITIDASSITFRGVKLDDRLNEIERRLAILRPNPELESRWNELKELGEKYRQLEKEIMDKENVWDKITK